MSTGMKWRGIGCPKCGCNGTEPVGCPCQFPSFGWSSGCHPIGGTDSVNPISSFSSYALSGPSSQVGEGLEVTQSGDSFWVTSSDMFGDTGTSVLGEANVTGPAIAIPVSWASGTGTGVAILGRHFTQTFPANTGPDEVTQPTSPDTQIYALALLSGGQNFDFFLITNGGSLIEADKCDGQVTAFTLGLRAADANGIIGCITDQYTTWTANDWRGCNCVTNPSGTTGCCLWQDGTGVQRVDSFYYDDDGCRRGIVSRIAECDLKSGVWNQDVMCPPTGCCVLASGQQIEDTTLGYCQSINGAWLIGACGEGGCCVIDGEPDIEVANLAECSDLGGTFTQGAECNTATGWCIDSTTGEVTAGVEEDVCEGTWTTIEPTYGCCTIAGVSSENIEEQFCLVSGGTFVEGDCPIEAIDPTLPIRVILNSATLDGPDPDLNCTNNFELIIYTNPITGSYTTSLTKSVDFDTYDGAILGDGVYASQYSGYTLLGLGTKMSINFLANDEYEIEMTILWSYQANLASPSKDYGLLCKTNPISMSGMGNCPSLTLTGSFDSVADIAGKEPFAQSCNNLTASDLVGSYNITLECQP